MHHLLLYSPVLPAFRRCDLHSCRQRTRTIDSSFGYCNVPLLSNLPPGQRLQSLVAHLVPRLLQQGANLRHLGSDRLLEVGKVLLVELLLELGLLLLEVRLLLLADVAVLLVLLLLKQRQYKWDGSE